MDPFGAVVNVVTLLKDIKKAYDKFKDAKDLPKAFGAIAGQIALATSIFEDVQKSPRSQLEADNIKGAIEQCHEDAKSLHDIYELVRKHINSDWRHKYQAYIATMKEGRKAEAEKIWKRILDGSHLLADHFNIQKLSEIQAALDEIRQLPSSLEQPATGDTNTFTTYGNQGFVGHNTGPITFGTSVAGDQVNQYTEDPLKSCSDCLKALCTTDPKEHPNKALEFARDGRTARSRHSRAPDTCQWIETDDSFQKWLTKDTPAILSIIGEPGIGKTTLSTHLVQKVFPSQLPKDCKLIYFFCNDNTVNSQRNSADAILRGLLWFLLVDDRSLYNRHFKAAYEAKGSEFFKSPGAQETLWVIFCDVVKYWRAGSLCVLIDAFDECDVNSREWLTGKVLELLEATAPVPRVKLVFTSRPTGQMDRLASKFNGSKLDMITSKIKADLDAFIKHEVLRLTTEKLWRTELAREVENYIITKAGRTFLWVSIALDEVAKVKENARVMKILTKIPKELFEVYRRIISEIDEDIRTGDGDESESDGEDSDVRPPDVLRLVLSASTPMSLNALAIALHFSKTPRDRLPTEVDIENSKQTIKRCETLLRLEGDPETNQVTIIHQSVKDFITGPKVKDTWRYTLTDSDAEEKIFQILKSYFNSQEFGDVFEDALRLCTAIDDRADLTAEWPAIKAHSRPHPSWTILSGAISLFSYYEPLSFHGPFPFLPQFLDKPSGETRVFLKENIEDDDSRHITWRLAILALLEVYNDVLLVTLTLFPTFRSTILPEEVARFFGELKDKEPPLTMPQLVTASVISGNATAASILRTYFSTPHDHEMCWEYSTNWFDLSWSMPWSYDMPKLGVMSMRLAAFDAFVVGFAGKNPLHTFVESGEFAMVRHIFINSDQSLSQERCRNLQLLTVQDGTGASPLMTAITHKRKECTEFLLGLDKHSSTIQLGDHTGRLPLHIAAKWDAWAVETLLNADTGRESLLVRDNGGRVPLHAAATVEVVKALVDADPQRITVSIQDNLGRVPLHNAVIAGSTVKVKALIDADPQRITVSIQDNGGRVPLHAAATVEVVKALVDADPQRITVSIQDNLGRVPLHNAVIAGSTEKVKALIDADPQRITVSTQDNGGSVPLHCAARNGTSPGAIQALIEADPDKANQEKSSLYVRNKDGNIPLHLALRYLDRWLRHRPYECRLACIRVLLDADLPRKSISLPDRNGNNALNILLRMGSPEKNFAAIEALLIADLDDNSLYTVDSDGKLPLRRLEDFSDRLSYQEKADEAQRKNAERLVTALVQADKGRTLFEQRFGKGMNVLHLAVSKGWSLALIKVILDIDSKGAAVKATDDMGLTPLEYAHDLLRSPSSKHMGSMEWLKVAELLRGRGGTATTRLCNCPDNSSHRKFCPVAWAPDTEITGI